MAKKNKFFAKKQKIDGYKFDSGLESRYYLYIKGLKDKGKITDFMPHPRKYLLLEGFEKQGKKIRPIYYIPDFEIEYNDGHKILIDVKGKETADFKLKRKLFDYRYKDLTLKLVTEDRRGEWVDYDEFKRSQRKTVKKTVSRKAEGSKHDGKDKLRRKTKGLELHRKSSA